MVRTIIPSLVLVLGLAAAAVAGNCRSFFVQPIHHAAVAVVAQPVVLYQAGRDVELDALAERVAARVEQRLSIRQQSTATKTAAPAESASVMGQVCAKCHSGATPKAGIVFDGRTPLAAEHITAALRAIKEDSMPKGRPLDPAGKAAVMEEMLNLEIEAVRPQAIESLPAAPPEAPPQPGELK